MKTIKAISSGKNYQVGDIKRITDVDADVRVRGGSWVYINKTEWKKSRKSVEVEKTPIPQPKTNKDIIPGQGPQRILPKKIKNTK